MLEDGWINGAENECFRDENIEMSMGSDWRGLNEKWVRERRVKSVSRSRRNAKRIGRDGWGMLDEENGLGQLKQLGTDVKENKRREGPHMR